MLCEMTRMALPVPPGFVVTTEACNEYLVNKRVLSETLVRGAICLPYLTVLC